MGALLDAPADTPLGRRDRAILELFYASGLRLAELVGLDLEDVNLGAKMVRVLGKGGKERIVPFNTATARTIRAYLNDRELLVRSAATKMGGAGPDKAGHWWSAFRRAKARRWCPPSGGPETQPAVHRQLSFSTRHGPQR